MPHASGMTNGCDYRAGKLTSSPDSFRGVLLLAGLHFYWKTGDLGEFAYTYYMHKLEWIRSINEFLGRNDHDLITFRTYLNIIGTTALIEVSAYTPRTLVPTTNLLQTR
jgi:hypothetical protein